MSTQRTHGNKCRRWQDRWKRLTLFGSSLIMALFLQLHLQPKKCHCFSKLNLLFFSWRICCKGFAGIWQSLIFYIFNSAVCSAFAIPSKNVHINLFAIFEVKFLTTSYNITFDHFSLSIKCILHFWTGFEKN